MNSTRSREDSIVLGVSFTILSVIYIPLYFLVLWVLTGKRVFKTHVTYQIMIHMGIANVLSLISTFMSGIFELSQSLICPYLDTISGALSSWFRPVYTLLTLILSINRLSSAFGFSIPYEKDIYKYLAFFMWFALIVFIIMTSLTQIDFHYILSSHWFYNGNKTFDDVLSCGRHVASIIYVTVVVKLVYMKYKHQQKIDKSDILILTQSMAAHFPVEILLFVRCQAEDLIAQWRFSELLYIFIYRSLPAVIITLVLALNRSLRKNIWIVVSQRSFSHRRVSVISNATSTVSTTVFGLKTQDVFSIA